MNNGLQSKPQRKKSNVQDSRLWAITKDDKCNNKLMATKKLSKEPEQTKHKKNQAEIQMAVQVKMAKNNNG